MGIYEFKLLKENDQFEVVFNRGQFVDSVTEGRTKYVLYSLSMFWVEVVYNSESNKIVSCSPFIGGKGLDRFSNVPKTL